MSQPIHTYIELSGLRLEVIGTYYKGEDASMDSPGEEESIEIEQVLTPKGDDICELIYDCKSMMDAIAELTIAAHKVKADTNALGRFLLIGAIVLMVGVVANLFFKIPAVSLAISAMFVLFSSLMIMWQTKMVIEGGETSYISAALTIFISIYNLFTSLLRLLMALTGND